MSLRDLVVALFDLEFLQVFAEYVPEIAKLQELNQLKDLRLAGNFTVKKDPERVEINLEATASEWDFYRNALEGLRGLVGRDYFLSERLGNAEEVDEYKSVSFKFPTGVSGRLFVYNPDSQG